MVKRATIEASVILAVEAVLNGRSVEDDRIECKSELISSDKARQLAGAANAALGESITWIVGIDEDGRRLVPLTDLPDLAVWWAQLEKRFDDRVAPDLKSLRVPVAGGEVLALHFTTDRAPYVVKVSGGGSPELETPWREGTRTRSAKRHELLRLLLPAIRTPDVTVLHCGGEFTVFDGKLELNGSAYLYVEHLAESTIVLPTHMMSATITFGGTERQLTARPRIEMMNSDTGGVETKRDGAYCYSPGAFRVDFSGPVIDLSPTTDVELGSIQSITLRLELGVVGGIRPIRTTLQLHRTLDAPSGPTLQLPVKMRTQSD